MSAEIISQPTLCEFSKEKLKLLKDTVCKGASDSEFQLFLHVCVKTGLDPFMKQIYSIPRGNQRTIQTSIDGLRLIAERSSRYAPGRETVYVYDSAGVLFSATSFIKKMTNDGTWHEVSATALFGEYNPGTNTFWKKMPHVMLAKCAEASALRKAFPAEMSGVYIDDEMQQAKTEEEVVLDTEDSMKEKFTFYAQSFPEENPDMVVEYLIKYAKHWKKNTAETLEAYKDEQKFLTHFNKWKNKSVSQ